MDGAAEQHGALLCVFRDLQASPLLDSGDYPARPPERVHENKRVDFGAYQQCSCLSEAAVISN